MQPPWLITHGFETNQKVCCDFSRTVGAAKLPKQGQEWDAGEASVVSGWGTLSSGGQASDVLMKVEVPIVSDTG